eukprot:COSAG02_NODE_54537_length_295_cov_1.301020_1_plen_56_part_00
MKLVDNFAGLQSSRGSHSPRCIGPLPLVVVLVVFGYRVAVRRHLECWVAMTRHVI